MGGITTLMCGNFRQILPAIPQGTRANVVNASVKRFELWHAVNVCNLRTNMRVQLFGDEESGEFASQLLHIESGTYTITEQPNVILLSGLGHIVQNLERLIDSVYPNFSHNHADRNGWQKKLF